MRAAAIDSFGGPEVISVHVLPTPVPESREVLIAVHTAGVAKWDADMREGWSPTGHTKFPFVLGTDGSGTVAALGSRVRRFKPGDRVYASNFEKAGFYAQYVAVESETVSLVPEALDLRHAGAIPITGLTALEGIDNALQLKKGESVIIHGASGGVGTLAVQFAKLRGARVLGTACGEEGVPLLRRLVPDAAVDVHHGDIAGAAERFAPDGIDALLGLAGGEQLERCVDALRNGSRLAYPNGVEPEPRKRHGIEIIPYDGIPSVREFDRLNRAVNATGLKVPIAGTYPLADAAEAHERLGEGHILGKIVLSIR